VLDEMLNIFDSEGLAQFGKRFLQKYEIFYAKAQSHVGKMA
jgi:hypothetical protein